MAITPGALGVIHGGIGILYQLLAAIAIVRIQGNPNTGCDNDLLPGDGNGIAHALDNTIGDRRHVFRVIDIFQNNGEFVTAPAKQHITFSN